MPATNLRPGQVVTWFPVAGKPGVTATIKAVTQRSAYRPAQVKFCYRPYRARKERLQQLPLALFLACLEERPTNHTITSPKEVPHA